MSDARNGCLIAHTEYILQMSAISKTLNVHLNGMIDRAVEGWKGKQYPSPPKSRAIVMMIKLFKDGIPYDKVLSEEEMSELAKAVD